MTLDLIGIIKFDFNITEIKLHDMSMDYTVCHNCKLMDLQDNSYA